MTVTRLNMRLWTLLLTGLLLASTLSRTAARAQSTERKRQPPTKPDSSKPSGQSNQSSGVFDETVKKADQAREAGHLDEALDLYGKALHMRPKWAEGWWYAGTILYDSDRYDDARDAFRNLVALEPKRAQAWGMLGLCEYQTHEYDRAVNSLQRGRSLGLAENPEIASVVRYHTALLYIRFEQFEVASDILREFLREGRESPKIIEAFGLTMLRMPFLPNEIPPDKREQVLIAGRAGFDMAAHRLDEARKSFDELLARYPDAPNVHYVHGVFLLSQDSDAALEEFRHELKISPMHVPSLLQMAFEYLKRNDYDAALPLAEEAARLAPKLYPARNALGRVLLELGQVERAVKELEEGARLAPNVPEMQYALARAYTRAGRKQDAARARETFQR
ncbi:MAG: tetratricopeptide repeat protein, partial [Chloracidobacterium sp.]|nr:tetratricopeptide repeat protein [Chloracidobacterium sp.]